MPDPIQPDSPEPQQSIFEFLEVKGGGKARVALRQEDSVPVLKPLEGLTQSGKYQLQGEIARGGVGVVLKGHDTELGRDVALKMIREEHCENPDVIQRFVEEAQIGGQLQHPGIVPVYDLGLQEGRPFFTMKLIKGRTLAALLEEGRESRRRLLAIFEAVCQTMAYAHTRGVIHRDLKPANVMVGAFGEVQVVDWGMGKVLKAGGVEDERRARDAQQTLVATVRSSGEPGSVGSQSVVGSVMGTPAYMPPEQALGEIEQMDERSDVFCLGAILAEILTRQPPYAGTGVEVLQRAARAELGPCRERIAACEADDELKEIATRCLVASRHARPRHAGEVQQHISLYLTGLEEKAHAAQVEAAEERIRVAEAKRKQKLTLALAASVLATVVLGGGGFWYVQSQKAARGTQLREQLQTVVLEAGRAGDATDALAKAARARDLLAQAESAMPAAVVADLDRIEAEARTALARREREEGNANLLATLDGLRGPGSEDSRFVIDWPETDRSYAAAFAAYGLHPDGGTVEEAAAALAERGEAERLAAGLDDWAFVRREAANPEGAKRLADVASRLDGDATRATLRTAMTAGDVAALVKLAADADARAMDPRTLRLLAESLRRLATPGVAYAFCRKAFEGHPDDFFLAHGLARSMYAAWWGGEDVTPADAVPYYLVAHSLRPDNYIASVELAQQLINAGDYAAAEKFLRDLIAGRPADAVLHAELGVVLENRGRTGEAETELERAVGLDGEQAWCRCVLARFLAPRGRADEALEHAQRAVALAPESTMAHSTLGSALAESGRFAEALAAVQRAVELAPRDPGHRANLATLLRINGRTADALAVCRKLLKDFPDAAHVQLRVAYQMLPLGRLEEALDIARAALARSERARRRNGALIAELHTAIAAAQETTGDTAAADESWRRALAADPADARLHLGAAQRLQRMGRNEEALPLLERTLVLEPSHFEAKWSIASTLLALGRPQEAIAQLQDAIEIDPKHALVRGLLAESLEALGRYEEGIPWARSAVELAPGLFPVRHALARLLAATGKDEEALAEIEAMPKPVPPPVLVMSGSIKARLGRREEALADLASATQAAPSYFQAHALLAGLLLDADRPEEALVAARRGVEVAPGIAGSHFTLGHVLGALQQWEEAEASFRTGLAIASDPRALVELAEMHAYRGDPEESVRRLRANVAGDPDDAYACGVLAWMLATGPLERRSADEALSLARRQLKLDPKAGRNILAAALFRAGQHDEAEREFATLLAEADNGHACLAFLRAMNLHALGNHDEARRWYDEGAARIAGEGARPWPDHVWLRDEAARLFGKE